MHRLLEFIGENDIFMSFRPDFIENRIVVTFRKTLCDGETWNSAYMLSGIEINLLSVDVVDVLLDFGKRFLGAYKVENAKRAAGSVD